jgi:hypothetical protein
MLDGSSKLETMNSCRDWRAAHLDSDLPTRTDRSRSSFFAFLVNQCNGDISTTIELTAQN